MPSTPTSPSAQTPSTYSPSTKSTRSRVVSMKLLPVKVGKNLKRQIRRLASFHHGDHHMILGPDHEKVAGETFDPVAPHSPPYHPVDIVHDFPLPPLTLPASPRVGYSKDSFTKSSEAVFGQHSARTSSQESLSHSLQTSSTMSSGPLSTSETHAEQQAAAPTSIPVVEDEGLQTPLPKTAEESELHPPAEEESALQAPAEEELAEIAETDEGQAVSSEPEPEPMFSSPPAVYVEPEVPDPFLIDGEENDYSDHGEEEAADAAAAVTESQVTISPPHEIPLASPSESIISQQPQHTVSLSLIPAPNINKDVPPPPSSDSETDSDEAPDLYHPGLVIPTMFLPIPNTDPLSTLLTKYIYPPEKRPVRDLTGDWQQSDFHTLVMTNSWRALARMARDRLVTTDPEDLTLILGLWYLRLSCLARLRLFNQTSAECTNLFVVLRAIEPLEARVWVFDRVLPFELEVMEVRIKYWAGDHMGHLDALYALLKKCKKKARKEKGNETAVAMWKERATRVCLIIASQLVEMKDFKAATKLLEPLCNQGADISTSALRSSIGRIYLQSGEVQTAAKHFAIVAADPEASQDLKDMNAGLLASAEGDWVRASTVFAALIQKDAENFAAVNNLCVTLLSQGKLKEGIDTLEVALKASPSSVVVAEPFLFNLSTLYELRSATAVENKRNLLLEVAKWSGDGLRTTCLKMPMT
ncbi:Trafficking protein particle complex subunit 12 [Hypsizygus marmoreus]|uniref:Trafficking protein particle complex subunit 12 n=1 Tax=Hypsizygus marmoreus TaxID=39966 RepID=A0A369JMB0_HYPMA|nr:Trafficking protein particle complex subunit 12 [Hypsizygus marmoreus]